METKKGEEAGITALFTELCEINLRNRKRVHFEQREHSKDFVKRKLRKCVYDVLFSFLSEQGRRKERNQDRTAERIVSYSYQLRCQRNFDEASRLEELLFSLNQTKDDAVPAALQLLCFLIDSTSAEDTPIGCLGQKLPVIIKVNVPLPTLPNGPKEYGDSCFLEADDRHFMHFPRQLFERGAMVQDVQLSKVCKLSPGQGLEGSGFFSVQGNFAEGRLLHFRGDAEDVKSRKPEQKLLTFEKEESLEDDGYVSNSFLSTSSSTSSELDLFENNVWDLALHHVPCQNHQWENRGQIPWPIERPYLTQAGTRVVAEICDVQGCIYLPEETLVKDIINLMLGIPSKSFQFNEATAKFTMKEGLCVTGLSPDALKDLLFDFLVCGNQFHQLYHFSQPPVLDSFYHKGLVFQAFTSGIRTYLQGYTDAVLCISPDKSVLQTMFLCQRLLGQMRFLHGLCEKIESVTFEGSGCPYGAHLLSFLYIETQASALTHWYYVMLSLLNTCLAPFFGYIKDWLFYGVSTDPYSEFLFEATDYVQCRDERFWQHGYVLKGAGEVGNVPLFLKDIAGDILRCGKTLNLIRLCKHSHVLFRVAGNSIPKVKLCFSEEETADHNTQWTTYITHLKQTAKQVFASREEMKRRAEQAKLELIEKARVATLKEISRYEAKVTAYREAVDAKKRKEFTELKEQMEKDLQRRADERAKEKADDKEYMDKLTRREDFMDRREAEQELRARLDLINFYANLTEDAANRERKALWKIQRGRLAAARLEFLVQQEVAWRAELHESYKTKKISNATERNSLDVEDGGELPSWAERPSDSGTIYVPAESGEENLLPTWARSRLRDSSAPSLVIDVKTDDLPKWALTRLISSPDSEETVTTVSAVKEGDSAMTEEAAAAALHVLESPGEDLPHDKGQEEPKTKLVSPTSKWRPAVRVVGDMLAESTEDKLQTHVKTVDDVFVSQESEGENTVKLSVRVFPDRNASSESSEQVPHRSTVQISSNMQATTESVEADVKLQTRKVDDKHVTEESQPNAEGLIVPRLKRYEGKHSSVESAPAAARVKKPSFFGHVSQLSNMAFVFDAPKLKRPEGFHIGRESDFKEFAIKPNIRLSKKYFASKESKQTDPMKPAIKMNADQHVSAESEFVDQDAVRISRFKQQNYLRHPSDSTVQNILYGDRFGKSTDEADSVAETLDLVLLGKKFDRTVKMVPVEVYQDDFDFLKDMPSGNLLAKTFDSSSGAFGNRDIRTAEGLKSFKYYSLPLMLESSVISPLSAQISLVNECVLRYYYSDLQIHKHFEALRHYMLMRDGEFALTLGDSLFKTLESPEKSKLWNPVFCQGVLRRAYKLSLKPDDAFFENLYLLKPDGFNIKRPLDFFGIVYKVDWPVNIVITESDQDKYSRIFKFMLQIRHIAWVLKQVWSQLKSHGHRMKILDCPQFRQLQFCRQEMEIFVNLIQGYIANQVVDVAWQEFQNDLDKNVHNMDDLIQAHHTFIGKAKLRCLLGQKAASVMKIIQNSFRNIHKFYQLLKSAHWQKNPSTGETRHPNFGALMKTAESTHHLIILLFKACKQMTQQGKHPHLEELVLRMDFSNFYSKMSAISTQLNQPG